MSFLDNLENNLKALEGRDEGGIDERVRREAELKEAKAAAPWSDKLKNSPWTKSLMGQATRAGFERRLKVNLLWIGTTLRLEARGQRWELRPGADGITSFFLSGNRVITEQRADMDSDPAELVTHWMGLLEQEASTT